MPMPNRRRAALVWLSVCAIVVMMGPASASPLVTIETTGDEVVGRLESLDSHGVRLAENGGSQLASRDVLKVVFEGTPKSPLSEAVVGEVELMDGSRFGYVGVEFDGETVRFTLRGETRIDASVASLAAWRLGGSDALELANGGGASDVLVVKRRDGGYAPVEGVVADMTSEGVRFALEADGGAEPVNAAWSRIGAIRFYRVNDRHEGERPVIVMLTDGGLIAAEEVAYHDGTLRLPRGSAPVESVASIDLSSGRVVSVDELKVLGDEYVAYFQAEAAPTKGYAFNRSLLGGSLALRYPDRRAPGAWPAVSASREFARGVALRSRGELRLELPANAQRLRGVVGIDPSAALAGSAEARIIADGKTLWSGAVDGESEPVVIDQSLATAKMLTLQVDYGDNLDAGDFVNFCDLRVIR